MVCTINLLPPSSKASLKHKFSGSLGVKMSAPGMKTGVVLTYDERRVKIIAHMGSKYFKVYLIVFKYC
jgi:hypothetical protein